MPVAEMNPKSSDTPVVAPEGTAGEPQPEERATGRRNAWWWLVPVVLAAIFFYLWWNSLALGLKSPISTDPAHTQLASTQGIEVPNVVGLTGREAYTKLETSGFKITVVAGEQVVIPTAIVTAQDPQAGNTARPGSMIAIEFGDPSAPDEPLDLGSADTVPSVIRESENSAVDTLRSAGYKVAVAHRSGDKAVMRSNTVMSQSPQAGTELAPGETVSIVVWTGQSSPQMRVVPNVIGLTVAQARERVTSAGFTFEAYKRPEDTGGRVADQFPPAGADLLKGGNVGVSWGE